MPISPRVAWCAGSGARRVALVFQGQDLRANFLFIQRAAELPRGSSGEMAIVAVVLALVADIKRGKDHDPVAVYVALELPGGVENFFDQIRLSAPEAAAVPRPPDAPWPCSWQ